MNAPPSFQFYPDDFIAGTGDMTQAEVGAYIRLLCYQWMKGGLPSDEARLFMMARTNNEVVNEAAVRYVIGSKFKCCADGLLRNDRMERVRAENKKWRAGSAKGGQVSSSKRVGNSAWGKRMASQRSGNEASNEAADEAQNEAATKPPSPSPSLSKERESTHANSETPSWKEFWAFCQTVGMAAEWYSKDKFLAAEQDNWRGKTNWRAYVTRFKAWWEADGRPMKAAPQRKESDEQPKKKWTNEEMVRHALS